MTNRNEGDFGETELDPAERAEAKINLDDPSAGDNEPWSPPDHEPRGAALVDVEDETLDDRLRQEEPDPTTDGDTDPGAGPMAGGDDPDAIPADEDILGTAIEAGEAIVIDDEPGPEAGAMHLE